MGCGGLAICSDEAEVGEVEAEPRAANMVLVLVMDNTREEE